MSRSSLIHRITPVFTSGIRQNHRMLIFSSALRQASTPSPSPSLDEAIHLTDNCIRRMKELQASGCSGFQYVFDLDSKINQDDRVFERGGLKLIVDNISYDFVKGATVDYVEELIRSAFLVTTNPSALGGCSCKSSFMAKQ